MYLNYNYLPKPCNWALSFVDEESLAFSSMQGCAWLDDNHLDLCEQLYSFN